MSRLDNDNRAGKSCPGKHFRNSRLKVEWDCDMTYSPG